MLMEFLQFSRILPDSYIAELAIICGIGTWLSTHYGSLQYYYYEYDMSFLGVQSEITSYVFNY